MVGALGLVVHQETTTMRIAEMSVIGTTGNIPNMTVPAGVRPRRVQLPIEQTALTPASGGGARDWNNETQITETRVQKVEARAPHFVLPRQNSAAISKGQSAA